MPTLELWSDGACSKETGGWAAILRYGQAYRELAGGVANTTNNRMELVAVIEGLKRVKDQQQVLVHSDSAYVCNAVSKAWLKGWQRNGWKTSGGDPVKNQDLWEELDLQLKRLEAKFVLVKGHNDIPDNERCDELAVAARLAIAQGKEFVWDKRGRGRAGQIIFV